MEAPNYTLVVNGKPTGPYTLTQLKEFKIKSSDFVRTPEMDDYKEAHELPELRQLFGFQKQNLIQYYGSFDQRLLAGALDLFMVSFVCVIIVFLITQFLNNRIAGILLTIGLLIIIPITNLVYHIIMESGPKQGTYGKQLLRIRVTDLQGERISPTQATGRNFAKIFSAIPLFVGYLYIFFNKQQQSLHDIIAGTLVVKDRLVI